MFMRLFKKRGSKVHWQTPRERNATYPAFEQLEKRELLAIMWMNQGTASNDADSFNARFVANADLARAIVSRAVSDWNAVITNFNYAEDLDGNPNNNLNNTFNLTVRADFLDPGNRGQVPFANSTYNVTGSPTAGTVRLDDNGGGAGWFFDQTPRDDAEFTAIANSGSPQTSAAFAASFIDVNGQTTRDDFYRTVVHEIGHAIGLTSDSNAALAGMFTPLFRDAAHLQPLVDPTGLSSTQLSRFQSTRPNPQFGETATFLDGHIYEGDLYGANNDPVNVFPQNSATPIAFETHPNELLNPGRSVPAGSPDPPPPNETARQWISDLDVQVLADAYGYTVTLPSTLDTAHATLDSQTGTLLVQGRTGALDDEIIIDTIGDQIRVRVQWPVGAPTFTATELVPLADVTQIVIARNGGNDNVNIPAALLPLVQEVQYVVSSNADAVEDANSVGGPVATNGIVDLSAVIPGNQVALRAAVIESNASGAARGIYVPRGNYRLSLAGTGGADQGDLDVLGNLTILGAGAGATVINATGLGDRIFEVVGTGRRLTLAGLTLTGGNVGGFGGGAIYVDGGAAVTVDRIAVVGNTTTAVGGGIRSSGVGTTLIVRNSVFTDNVSTNAGGAISIIPGDVNTFTFGNNIFARNTGGSGHRNIYTTSLSTSNLKNEGNNVTDNNAANVFNANLGDLIDTTTLTADLQIVTNVADVIDPADGTAGLSLREAVIAANAGNDTIWRNTLYSITDLRADGNDNGIVDQADWLIWKRGFGNSLTVTGVL